MGIYTAFLDLSLGLASPLMGWFGESAGLPMVFVGVAFAVLSATAIAIKLAVRQSA
jgi:hypothetical protein